MIQVAFENILISLVGLAFLVFLGGGFLLRLPAQLAPYRWPVAPWVGYSLLVVLTQFLTNSPLSLTALESAYVAAAFAALLYVGVAWRRYRAGKIEVEDRSIQPEEKYLRLLAGITLLTFVLGVLPLWSYGYTTVIGENWDAEIYMGLGEYLKTYPQTELRQALPNPVLDTLINPPYSLRTHGFSYFHAALGFLPFDSLRTMAPLLALLHALSIPAAYFFFRAGLKLPLTPSLLACAALGLNAFLLWVTYNTFGMQVPSFGLLPLAVGFTLLLIDTAMRNRPPLIRNEIVPLPLYTALFVAAIAVTYHPALTAYAALVGPATLWALWRGRSSGGARRLFVALGSVALLSIGLSLVSQLKSLEGFIKQYSEKIGGLGLTGFTSPADAFGFALSFRDLLPPDPGRPLYTLIRQAYEVAGWMALALSVTFVGFYLYRLMKSKGGEATPIHFQPPLLAGAVAYVLLFWQPLDYPYGWFKALSFVAFAFVGAAVGGLWLLLGRDVAQRRMLPPYSPILRRGASATGVALLALMLITTGLTVTRYWGEPIRFGREMLEVGAVRDILLKSEADGQSVYVSSSPHMRGLGRLFNGLLSYYLRDTDLYGTFDTANSRIERLRENGLYTYMLLHTDDNPAEYGVGSATLAWHNSLLSLYVAPSKGEARRDLYHENYEEKGSYPVVRAGSSLPLVIGPNTITAIPDVKNALLPASLPIEEAPRQFTLGLAAFTTSTVLLRVPGSEDRVLAVPPGYTTYRSVPVQEMGAVTLQAEEGELYVRWAHLEEYRQELGHQPGLSADGAGFLLGVSSQQEGEKLVARVSYLNNLPQVVSQTLSLDIYGTGGEHFGYWNFNVPARTPLDMDWSLDAAKRSLTLAGDGPLVQSAGSFAGEAKDGSYVASLLVYEKGRVVETANDIFKFEIRAGKLTDFKPRRLAPIFLP